MRNFVYFSLFLGGWGAGVSKLHCLRSPCSGSLACFSKFFQHPHFSHFLPYMYHCCFFWKELLEVVIGVDYYVYVDIMYNCNVEFDGC